MKIEIVKQKRKTIVLKVVDSENAVLKVPVFATEKVVQNFLNSKKSWLEKTALKMKQKESVLKEFDFDNFIYFNGKQALPCSEIELGFDALSKSEKRKAIRTYYLSYFDRLVEYAKELSNATGLTFDEVKSTESVRVWGSYNSKRQMKLNFKLLILPEELVKYVILHELCHSKHMNHKPQFWNELALICPNYKQLKSELSKYSFVLKYQF